MDSESGLGGVRRDGLERFTTRSVMDYFIKLRLHLNIPCFKLTQVINSTINLPDWTISESATAHPTKHTTTAAVPGPNQDPAKKYIIEKVLQLILC
jgi:hypothetical protein